MAAGAQSLDLKVQHSGCTPFEVLVAIMTIMKTRNYAKIDARNRQKSRTSEP
jgi:hypothetical protein